MLYSFHVESSLWFFNWLHSTNHLLGVVNLLRFFYFNIVFEETSLVLFMRNDGHKHFVAMTNYFVFPLMHTNKHNTLMVLG